jgi:hypothetical protein
MVKDLSRVFQLLKRSLPNVKVVEGMELICGKKYNLEKATAAATTCWAGDVIHTYAKMALHLQDAIAPQEAPRPGGSSRPGVAEAAVAAVTAANAPTASANRCRGTGVATQSGPGTGRSKGRTSRCRVLALSFTGAREMPLGATAVIPGGAAATTAAINTAAAEGPTTGAGRHAASAVTESTVPMVTAPFK